MKAIKFLAAATVGTLYNVGEVAGFEDHIADDLIEQGVAEEVKLEKPKGSGKQTDADKAKAELEALSDENLDKLIAEKNITVAADADRAAKIAAVLGAK